jgi:hypothetical protein
VLAESPQKHVSALDGMRIRPEARFLALCAREPGLVDAEELRDAAEAIDDWDRLVRLAESHGVVAYAGRRAEEAELALPAYATEALHQRLIAQTAQMLALDAELGRVLDALHTVAIPAIVLKGPAVGRSLYPSRQLRPFTDIDLVVQDGHEASAARALEAHGYTEVPFEAETARQAHAGHVHEGGEFHRVFVAGQGNVSRTVELHTDPLQLGLRPACEAGRWQRAVPVPDVPRALMLGPEDQLVQLAVHAHKHGFSRLIWLKDLDLLLRRQALDWDLVVEIAAAEGVRASVWYALDLAALILGTELPAGHARLSPSAAVRKLYRVIWPPERIAGLEGFMRRRAVQFHAAESLRGTLPSLVLMGRRRARLRAFFSAFLPHRRRA